MSWRYTRLVACFFICGLAGLTPAIAPPALYAAEPAKPSIAPEATAAIDQMEKSLSRGTFSFEARTIRVYEANNGQPLHIFHTMKIVVRRPDRLAVDVAGDDGKTRLLYDGKNAAAVGVDSNSYALIPAPSNLEGMIKEVMGRLHVDFPLADFLVEAPGKAFLSDVTSCGEVNTVAIDSSRNRHLFFSQKGGIELELWVEKSEQALPRRLIVTYRSLPGEPNFIAEFSNWNFSVQPTDADFVFQPPAGSKQIALDSAPAQNGSKGGKR
jgi:hypothetical protein